MSQASDERVVDFQAGLHAPAHVGGQSAEGPVPSMFLSSARPRAHAVLPLHSKGSQRIRIAEWTTHPIALAPLAASLLRAKEAISVVRLRVIIVAASLLAAALLAAIEALSSPIHIFDYTTNDAPEMDSMRHLSTSLPQTSRRRNDQTDLLSSFKAAALSVTNLYKTAAADSARARELGFQDAIDDLLAFLDRENIGVGDGEGWRIRRWATERLEETPAVARNTNSEDEEDAGKAEEADTRSSSPDAQRKPAMNVSSSELPEDAALRRSSEPPHQQAPASNAPAPAVPSIDEFAFRTSSQLPNNHDREAPSVMEMDATPTALPSAVRIAPRSSTKARFGAQARRENRGSNGATINFNLASAAGTKRKIPYPDFFDISGLNPDGQDKKDGGGKGAKRHRHV